MSLSYTAPLGRGATFHDESMIGPYQIFALVIGIVLLFLAIIHHFWLRDSFTEEALEQPLRYQSTKGLERDGGTDTVGKSGPQRVDGGRAGARVEEVPRAV